eukprot:GHUV01034086.1.p1 GENE.GHUV01034086.1~~GHUV01034086.1.p1  ORF type:complete len:253 (+),score=67.09 GHUV01034086.1:148-906(+)
MTVLGFRTGTPSLSPRGGRQPSYRLAYSGPRSVAARVHSEQQQLTQPSPNVPSVVTDAAVPEGHQSLHGLLYGSGDAADAHQAAGYQFREGEDDGTSLLPVSSYLSSRDGEKPLGVYAVYDEKHNVQYVGYSRNIVLAVKGHLSRVGDDRCAFVKPLVFANKAMATRRHMEALAEDWLEEAGVIPPGNGVEAELWLGSSSSDAAAEPTPAVDITLLSPTERAEYEEKRLKLKKAMVCNRVWSPDQPRVCSCL